MKRPDFYPPPIPIDPGLRRPGGSRLLWFVVGAATCLVVLSVTGVLP
jgi:hypothetical protein